MNSIISDFTENFKSQITNFLTKSNSFIRCLAFLTGFIKRNRMLNPTDMIVMMILASFRNKPSSLLDMRSILKSLNPTIEITPQSLQERINTPECTEFLKMTLEHLIKAKIMNKDALLVCQSELLGHFKRVLIEDSSKCELSEELQPHFKGHGGNASKSSVKINTIYDLTSAKFIQMSEYSGTKSDQTIGELTLDLLKDGDLLLRDLGYLKIKSLHKIDQIIRAFFLSRLSGSVTIRLKNEGEQIPFAKLFEKYSKDGKLDIYAYIGEEKYYTRIIAFRVPEEVANKRRRNLNKTGRHHGRKPMTENLSRQNFSIFITNVSVEIWPAEIIPTIYRIRWQIELIYRSWKSQLKIHILVGTNPDRIRSLLYAKWMAIIICATLYELVEWYAKVHLKKEASFHKIINWLLLLEHFRKLVLDGPVMSFLDELFKDLKAGWCKDSRKKTKSTRKMIENKEPSYIENTMNIQKLVA